MINANMLVDASKSERQDVLVSMIEGMRLGDPMAGSMAYRFAISTNVRNSNHAPIARSKTSFGHFTQDQALKFLPNTARLSGFINAIERWDDQEAVIDVGCGPFPVLALAAAVYHPKAEISAIEITPQSAETAQRIVELFGLSDRLKVVNKDISNHKIDTNTTAAVTETFSSALVDEPGPRIVRMLHAAGVPTITPSRAKLRLQVGVNEYYNWVDLRTDTHARIDFEDSPNRCNANVAAAYHDDNGLVLDYGDDVISSAIPIGGYGDMLDALDETSKARLAYEMGLDYFHPHFEAINALDNPDI